MKGLDLTRPAKALAKNKYVLFVLALGLFLLLLPRSSPGTAAPATGPPEGQGAPLEASGIPLDTESERLAALLADIRGVGAEAEVLLSRQGAVVVCAGADNPAVRLNVTNAVSAYTGLGSDKIIVMQKKQEVLQNG